RVVNARDAKHVPGRKTDVSDAAWLQRLHEFGLLRGSFRPQGAIAALRAYLRQRERLLDYAAAHIQHMQKALTQMNPQIHHVISDITGPTGMRIIRAIVAGERDPDTLASYRDIRCHSSVETVRQALIGNYREEHLFALAQALELYEVYQAKVATCDEKIEVVLERLKQPCRAPAKPLRAARHKTRQPNAPAFDARGALYALLGVDLTQIHGLGPYLALKLISECGTDLSAWPSAKHFTSWLSLAPGNKISGGKILSSRTRPSGNRAAALLRLAATTVGRTETALGAFYRRLSAGIWPAGWLCEALGVSRGGFYAWLTRPRSQRSRSDEELGAKVRTSFVASDRTYGARRVWKDMLAEGLSCGLHRIERLMRLQALKARPRRRRLPPDLGERQATAVAPNVLDRTFDAS